MDPQNLGPNLALNLEISDLVNSKKGNAYGDLSGYESKADELADLERRPSLSSIT